MAPPKTGLKNGLKAVGQAASGAQFIKIPALATPPSYRQWLKYLLDTPQNKQIAMRSAKSDIDELLRQKASEQFKSRPHMMAKALAEITSKASEEAWKYAQAQLGGDKGGLGRSLADEARKLRLPRVCHSCIVKARKHDDSVNSQTYRGFADLLKFKNPDVKLNKDLVDMAMHVATSTMPKKVSGGTTVVERMLIRVSTNPLM